MVNDTSKICGKMPFVSIWSKQSMRREAGAELLEKTKHACEEKPVLSCWSKQIREEWTVESFWRKQNMPGKARDEL